MFEIQATNYTNYFLNMQLGFDFYDLSTSIREIRGFSL